MEITYGERVGPPVGSGRVGSGPVGSDFLSAIAGRVGSTFRRVGSGPRKVSRGYLCIVYIRKFQLFISLYKWHRIHVTSNIKRSAVHYGTYVTPYIYVAPYIQGTVHTWHVPYIRSTVHTKHRTYVRGTVHTWHRYVAPYIQDTVNIRGTVHK